MKDAIVNLLAKKTKLRKEDVKRAIEIPPDNRLGDYAFPCFILSKKLKKHPDDIATELREQLIKSFPSEIEDIKAEGAYINFFVNKSIFARKIISKILKEKNNYGKQKRKLRGMIEFSQANTHKAFHVGHIRGTSLGESLARIAEFFGEKVIRANYQGDTGMHVAKWIWCYQKYHKKEKLRNDEAWIAKIYVDAIKRLNEDKDENEKLQTEVEEINRKLELKKDKKLMKLWRRTRKASLDAFEKIYLDLNTKFNRYYFEKDFEKRGKKIALDLLKKNIAKMSESAIIMDLEKYNLGVWVLLRKDGTVLYSAKDLALVEKKFKDYNLDFCIYIHGKEQDMHFNQLLKTLELMKFKHLKKIYSLNFDLVRLPGGKMSSRTGENILYSIFISELTDYAKQQIKKRENKISKTELEKRAKKIAIAAVKYSFLKQDSNKVIVFNKKEALNFEGNSGPYLQYSYARASSILRRTRKKAKISKIKIREDSEIKLVKKLSDFPEIVNRAYEQFNPALIANYSFELAQIFNEFYHVVQVVGTEEEEKGLALVESFKYVIGNCLHLLGIEVMEKM